MVFPLKMVIFNSYVKLPEGNHPKPREAWKRGVLFCFFLGRFLDVRGYPVVTHCISCQG
jgi:hypothetical protein